MFINLLIYIFSMYINGLNPTIQEIYPSIEFPVSRGTPSVYSLSFWDHSENWSYLHSLNALVSTYFNNQLNY